MAEHRIRAKLACVVVAMAGLGAMAQDQPPKPPGNDSPSRPDETYKPGQQAQPGERPRDRMDNGRRDARVVVLAPTEWLDGTNIKGPNDDKLGEIKDLVLNRDQRRITFALVGHGGVLKVGEKITAVPFRALEWDGNKKQLFLPMTKEQFDAAPTLDSGEWKTLSDSTRIEPIYSHFNMRDERNYNTRDDDMVPDRKDDGKDDRKKDERTPGPARMGADEFPVVKVSDIRGKTLVGNDGREVGKVDDLVVDTSSGRVAFVAVTFGGVMGIGKDRVAVPWSAFDINKEGRLFLATMDKEQINSAPRMTQKDWAELRDPAFGATVYKHYGKRAAWLEVGPDQSSPALREYRRLYTAGAPRDVSGTIASIEEETPMDGVPKVMVLKINTTARDTVTVQACPRSMLDEHRLELRKGDAVVIKGREATIDGKPVVIATQITGADGRPITLRQEDKEPDRR